MQGKRLVMVFGIAVALICLYQLSFTFLVSGVEKRADAYAEKRAATAAGTDEDRSKEFERARRTYINSISAKPLGQSRYCPN